MMKIINLSKKIIITDNVKEIETLSDKFFGLLRNSNPRSLLFKTRFGIHTFFLKNPIDVIILDRATSGFAGRSCNFSPAKPDQNYRNFKVVKMKELKPNRLFFWNPKYFLVLELPEGTIKKTKMIVGDTLYLLS